MAGIRQTRSAYFAKNPGMKFFSRRNTMVDGKLAGLTFQAGKFPGLPKISNYFVLPYYSPDTQIVTICYYEFFEMHPVLLLENRRYRLVKSVDIEVADDEEVFIESSWWRDDEAKRVRENEWNPCPF